MKDNTTASKSAMIFDKFASHASNVGKQKAMEDLIAVFEEHGMTKAEAMRVLSIGSRFVVKSA